MTTAEKDVVVEKARPRWEGGERARREQVELDDFRAREGGECRPPQGGAGTADSHGAGAREGGGGSQSHRLT